MPLISIAIARNTAFRQPRTATAEPWPLELPKIRFAVWRAAIVASLRYRAANREKWYLVLLLAASRGGLVKRPWSNDLGRFLLNFLMLMGMSQAKVAGLRVQVFGRTQALGACGGAEKWT